MDKFQWTNVALFADFPPEELERVKPIFSTFSVDKGEKLIAEGDTGDEMYILVKGRVRITKSMLIKGMSVPLEELKDPRKVLATLDGALCPLFGEMALIDRDTRSATVETLEPCEFLRTDRARFFDLLEREPIIGVRLLTALSKRLAATVRKNNSELIKLTTALALALSRA
ncbi:CRP-like cAMP-binding protein [Desulfobaculum xiamenense]|uniref:CRP-like cAMP-binding protein n=1 Tax=Desulfobaculum xiamenense TaxID=995050 RepID=A0A846QSF4_9BACT|nr:cyclic nucleotide-binding domain-containing protein [Desulfobaculum xiamenense]NJB68104.1 CRP-like cAMP-binding protein [Desulfobaculum xiamenense]